MIAHTFQVFSYELRRNLRRKGFLFATFGIPLIGLILLLGYQLISSSGGLSPSEQNGINPGDFTGVQHAGYVDKSGRFGDLGAQPSALTRYDDEAAARAALDSGKIDVYYRIEPDYMQTGDVTLVMNRLNVGKLDSDAIRQLLLDSLADDVPDRILYERLIHPSNITTVNVGAAVPQSPQDSSANPQGAQFLIVYIFAIILLIGLFTTNNYLMQSVIEEKESRLIEILLSSLRPTQLLAGKILALGLLGLLQIGVWIGSVFLLARIGMSGMAGAVATTLSGFIVPWGLIPLLFVYFVLAYLMFAGAFSIVGALANGTREGSQYAAIFTLPAVIPLWFTSIFASTPSGPIPTFLSLFPITAPLAMVQRLAISVVPPWQIALSLGLLIVALVVVLWLAGRVFRVQTLLAGQPPRLRDLPMLIRG